MKENTTLQNLSKELDDVYTRMAYIESLLICLSLVSDNKPVFAHLPSAIYAVVDPLQRIACSIDDVRTTLDRLIAQEGA